MASITTLQRAPILDGLNANLGAGGYSVVSSDTSVATIAAFENYNLYVVSADVGTATITATRLADNATATLDVSVIASDPFTIQLGAPVAK